MKRRHTLAVFLAGVLVVLLAAGIAAFTLSSLGIRPVLVCAGDNADPVYVIDVCPDETGGVSRPFIYHGKTYLPVRFSDQTPVRNRPEPHPHSS